MLEVADLRKIDSYEFEFFCSERHTIQSIAEGILLPAYTEIAKEAGVPNMGALERMMGSFFQACLYERYALREEEDFDGTPFTVAPSEVKALWVSGEFYDLDDFVDYCMEVYHGFADTVIMAKGPSIQKYVRGFLNDIAKVLNYYRLHFHNLPHDYEQNLFLLVTDFFEKKHGVVDFEVNNPICEVW